MSSTWAIGATYEDVQAMITGAAAHYNHKCPVGFDYWLSEANWIFMEAYYSYDPGEGMEFSSWLYFLLYRRLTSVTRKHARIAAQANLSRIREDVESKKVRLQDFISNLSNDAKEVVSIIVDSPNDVKLALLSRPTREPLPIKMKQCLLEFLSDIGWANDRIFDTFTEITEALC